MNFNSVKPITSKRMRMKLLSTQKAIARNSGKSNDGHLLEKTSKALESLLAEGHAFEMLHERTQRPISVDALASVTSLLTKSIATDGAHVLKNQPRMPRSNRKKFATVPAADRYEPHQVLTALRQQLVTAAEFLPEHHFDDMLSEWCYFIETILIWLAVWRALHVGMDGNVTLSQVEYVYDHVLKSGADIEGAITLYLEERLSHEWRAAQMRAKKPRAAA